MIQLDRHIRNTVLVSMLVAIAIITMVDLVFSLADEMADTDANYSVANALSFVLLSMPTSIYELLPFTALGGALFGLGILASNNELIVMQAAGIRVWRIVFSVLKPTFIIMLASLLLGEYIAPPLEQRAQSNKAIQRSGDSAISAEQGVWRKIDDTFIHINAIAPGGELMYGVSRYELDGNRNLRSASFAETARYVRQGNRSYWLLNNIENTQFETGRISNSQYLEESWQVELSPELLSVLLVDPDKQSITGLWQFAAFFAAQGMDADTYYLAFWKKLLQPLATLFLVILAIAFIFGPLRDTTMGFRVFIAIGIGLVFTILQRSLEPASLLYGFSPLLAVLTPIAICAVLGITVLSRVR